MSGFRRMRLRRADGRVYLERWGFFTNRLGGVYVHRMDAPDPGVDLHDHPWTFVSVVLAGGYTEERAHTRDAPSFARFADRLDRDDTGQIRADCRAFGTLVDRGHREHRRRWSIRRLRLDECHRIVELDRSPTWTLVVCGPVRRKWGFYLSSGWLNEHTYDRTVRVDRRDLWNEEPSPNS